MFSLLLCSMAIISTVVGQTTEDGIACQECINEMHRFGQLIHDGREAMAGYLAENYCPTLEEHAQDCPENLAAHYPDMVNAVVDRFIAGEQGAVHMCQSMGACRPVPKIFTCDECIEGMEWIEAYLEDPIFQAEAALVHPRTSPVHPGHPASLHPHARHGHGEVHGAGRHLQQRFCSLQPRLDNPPPPH